MGLQPHFRDFLVRVPIHHFHAHLPRSLSGLLHIKQNTAGSLHSSLTHPLTIGSEVLPLESNPVTGVPLCCIPLEQGVIYSSSYSIPDHTKFLIISNCLINFPCTLWWRHPAPLLAHIIEQFASGILLHSDPSSGYHTHIKIWRVFWAL